MSIFYLYLLCSIFDFWVFRSARSVFMLYFEDEKDIVCVMDVLSRSTRLHFDENLVVGLINVERESLITKMKKADPLSVPGNNL